MIPNMTHTSCTTTICLMQYVLCRMTKADRTIKLTMRLGQTYSWNPPPSLEPPTSIYRYSMLFVDLFVTIKPTIAQTKVVILQFYFINMQKVLQKRRLELFLVYRTYCKPLCKQLRTETVTSFHPYFGLFITY